MIIIKPSMIVGGVHKDHRGTLSFINDFDMGQVKRFYMIEHFDTTTVRAWQGHKTEQKWFYVLNGGFKIVVVQPDSWDNPSSDLPVSEFELTTTENQVLHIPGGYANGFKAITPNAKLMVFSDFTLQDTPKDDFRFEQNLWYNWK